MASISKVLDNLTGQTEQRAAARKELSTLVKMANLKLDTLEAKLVQMFQNREIESKVSIIGDRLQAFSREYRVNYSDGDVSNAVTELVDTIMDIGSESAQKIICKILKNGINSMFASASLDEEEKRLFLVVMEGAALIRYGFYIWKSAEQDEALFKHAESVVAITYARSIVDHTKVSEDELNDAIGRSLGNVTIQEIIDYKKQLLELYKLKASGVDFQSDVNLMNSGDDESNPYHQRRKAIRLKMQAEKELISELETLKVEDSKQYKSFIMNAVD